MNQYAHIEIRGNYKKAIKKLALEMCLEKVPFRKKFTGPNAEIKYSTRYEECTPDDLLSIRFTYLDIFSNTMQNSYDIYKKFKELNLGKETGVWARTVFNEEEMIK